MTLLRRNRIAAWTLLFVGVFLFGTVDASAQTTYYWIGGNTTPYSSWASSTNWSLSLNGLPAPSFPSNATDIAVFQGASPTTEFSVALANARSIGEIKVINCITKLSSSNVSLTVNTATITNGILKMKYAASNTTASVLVVNSSLAMQGTFSAIPGGSVPAAIEPDGTVATDVRLFMGATSTMSMNDLRVCRIGAESVTPNIRTVLNRPAGLLASAVRIEGNIELGSIVNLGQYDMWLGKTATMYTTGNGSNVTFVAMTESHNYSPAYPSPIGRLIKRDTFWKDALGAWAPSAGYFTYETGCDIPNKKGPNAMSIDVNSLVDLTNDQEWNSTMASATMPFRGVSVRFVQLLHPANFSTANKVCLKYWVVKPVGYPDQAFVSASNPGHNICYAPEVYPEDVTAPQRAYGAVYYEHYEDIGGGQIWYTYGSTLGSTNIGGRTVVSICPTYYFGDVSIAEEGTGLPVELTAFSARYVRDNVELSWQTATELNNYGFAIERSEDGDVWNEVDFVPGHGNSYSPKNYTYTDMLDDALRSKGQLSYRLRQVDRDGTTDYSNIVVVRTTPPPAGVHLHAAYPNPFNPATTLSFSLSEATPVRITVYSLLGRQIATLVDNALMDAGFHTVGFNGNELPSGAYVIELNAGGTLQRQRVVLSK